MGVYVFVCLITVSRKQKAIASLNNIINRLEVIDIKGIENPILSRHVKKMQKSRHVLE